VRPVARDTSTHAERVRATDLEEETDIEDFSPWVALSVSVATG
jgi:hypothetical protein